MSALFSAGVWIGAPQKTSFLLPERLGSREARKNEPARRVGVMDFQGACFLLSLGVALIGQVQAI